LDLSELGERGGVGGLVWLLWRDNLRPRPSFIPEIGSFTLESSKERESGCSINKVTEILRWQN